MKTTQLIITPPIHRGLGVNMGNSIISRREAFGSFLFIHESLGWRMDFGF
jgi:hypothetical protein